MGHLGSYGSESLITLQSDWLRLQSYKIFIPKLFFHTVNKFVSFQWVTPLCCLRIVMACQLATPMIRNPETKAESAMSFIS